MGKRKVCVVTGSRAEYGLLFWLMKEIQADPALELQLIVSGMHLSAEFGSTYHQIEDDGFPVSAKVDLEITGDSPLAIARSTGLGLIRFSEAIEKLRPDLAVVIGDRFESFAATQAAFFMRVPIAHLHGGEITQGALDESMRHAMTKMACFHYTTAEEYRQRVIQLGEHPDRVFNVGSPGLDGASRLKPLTLSDLEERISFKLGQKFFLVTYHPETLGETGPVEALDELLGALDALDSRAPGAKLLFTKANADAGGQQINRRLEQYVARHPDRAVLVASLGQTYYLNAVRHSAAVIGNSSSGIIEVPFFKKPTVNIGNRQKGRLKAKSILDCGEKSAEIQKCIETALSAGFQSTLSGVKSLYGQGNTALRIKESLKAVSLEGVTMKGFYDLPSK